MHLNFKNVLVGLGTGMILITSVYLGLYSSANYFDSYLELDNNISQLASNGENICGLVNTYYGSDKRNFSENIRDVVFDNQGNMYISEKTFINVRLTNGKWVGLYDDQLTNIRDFFVDGEFIYLLDETTDEKGFTVVILKKYVIDFTTKTPKITLVNKKITGGSTLTYSKQSGYIFIGTWLNDNYQKLNISDFSLVSKVDVTINSDAKPSSITELHVGPDNNLYVLDDGNKVVKVFSVVNDSLITHFGQEGLGNDALLAVIGITLAPNGDVYVSESLGKIKKFIKNSAGEFVFAGYIEVFNFDDYDENQITRLTFGPNGNLFVIRGHFTVNKEDEYYAVDEFTPPCLRLTIIKETTPSNPQSFDFTADFFGVNNPRFSLVDDGKSNNFKEFIIFKSTNSITEKINTHYVLTSVKCFQNNKVEISDYKVLGSTLTLNTILHNQKITCIFNNSYSDEYNDKEVPNDGKRLIEP